MGVIIRDIDILMDLVSDFDTSELEKEIKSIGAKIKITMLHEAVGITTPDTIYFDETRLKSYNPKKRLFVILHEFAHYKRIWKSKTTLNELIKSQSEEEYIKFVIDEEILADRYASIQFFNITEELFPTWDMQNLHLKSRQDAYIPRLKAFYAFLRENPDLNYSDLIKTYIIND